MGLRNNDLRESFRKYGVRQWQLAEALGVREETLCRKFRHELPDGEKNKLLQIVKQLSVEKEA